MSVGPLPLQKLKMWNLPEVDLIGGPAQGLVVIVTGPTSGIGREVASALARRGATGACSGCVDAQEIAQPLLPARLPAA